MLRELPPRARWYVVAVIALGGLTFAWLIPRATFTPFPPFIFLIVLSSLTSAFKVQFPIASGSNMSVSYVVDIASLILRGPHATMIVGALSGWIQTTVNSPSKNPPHRTLFSMACLVLTVQAAGQAFERLEGRMDADLGTIVIAVSGMAVTYFLVNTVPIALAIALTTGQRAWQVWRRDFAPTAGNYMLGAFTAYVMLAVTESSGLWLTLLLSAPLLYLTYRVYRTRVETEARQGAILEAANDAIVTMDHNLAIREFNPAAERMFGYQRLDILGRNVDMLLPPLDRALKLSAFKQYMTDGRGSLKGGQLDLSGLRADGTEFPAEVTVARVGGERAVITAFVRDITERRALEERLRQSQKLEAIGRLAGGVAHDFNNILMSIMGSADLMLVDMPPGGAAQDEANEIKQAVQRGAGLTKQLLAVSRRQATSPTRFALGDVLSGMDTMLRRLIGPEIDFVVVRPPGPTIVRAEPAQIEQVVLNLVVNARDAMPQGGRLTVRLDEVELSEAEAANTEGRPGRYARLAVSDTGTGIDERVRARLFEPFFTTKEPGTGTGLGLSIVYGIVKGSGGYINVVSEAGKGATFLVYLPIAPAARPTSPGPVA